MSQTLPLFPLTTVLYPGMLLPLNIFEDRYRVLARDMLNLPEHRRRFGVIAIKKGREVGVDGVYSLFATGCVAQVRTITPRADEGFDLLAVGTDRFRLLRLHRAAPYFSGEIEELPDPTGDADRAAAAVVAASAAFRAYLQELTTQGGASVEIRDLPDEPVLLSYVIAAAMVIDLPEHQALLGEPDAAVRLAAERSLLNREIAMLRATTSRPAPDMKFTPFSAN